MSSSIVCGGEEVIGSNGAIEAILIGLIRHSPDDSPLLAWALNHFRNGFPGIVCDAAPVLASPQDVAIWRETLTAVLAELGADWTDYGRQWLEMHREALIQLGDPSAGV